MNRFLLNNLFLWKDKKHPKEVSERKREVGFVLLAKFTAFTQELKNAKILRSDLNKRASRYTHFAMKSITIAKNKFPLLARTALQRLQCIFITLWKYSNKRRIGTVALFRVNTVIANIAPEGRFYSDTVNTLNFATKSRTIDEPFVRRTVGKGWKKSSKHLKALTIKLSNSDATPLWGFSEFFPRG